MKLIIEPDRSEWEGLLKRPYVDNKVVMESVQGILSAVRQQGDEAVRSFTRKFDGVEPANLEVSERELEEADSHLPASLKRSILQAKENILRFHKTQLSKQEIVETMPGVRCWRKNLGIERVGLYVPGGTAPLFSTVLMLGVPAVLAGCSEIILCTPCGRDEKIHPAILFAAKQVGVTRIFKLGGAQAIAAMAYGTATVPAVYKIFGPGNQFVTAAKQLVQMQGVSIDMPAGPSEVCVLADETADAGYVASDLLSQAEHGADSQVLLVSIHEQVVKEVIKEIKKQVSDLPRKELAEKALANSRAIVLSDMEKALELVNAYAAEHLIISCKNADEIAEKVINAGSVFIGNYSPESVGDYASGTNHTLPTNGYARAYSGVSVDSFVKKISFQKLSRDGLQAIAETVIQMAEAEGLEAHAQAVKIRLQPRTL